MITEMNAYKRLVEGLKEKGFSKGKKNRETIDCWKKFLDELSGADEKIVESVKSQLLSNFVYYRRRNES